MVKPPKRMEPEEVDLEKAGRAAGKAFQEDSFANYMARKIDLQRKQFGLELPPDPRLLMDDDDHDDAQQDDDNKTKTINETTTSSSSNPPAGDGHGGGGILSPSSSSSSPNKKRKLSSHHHHVSFAADVKEPTPPTPTSSASTSNRKRKKRKKRSSTSSSSSSTTTTGGGGPMSFLINKLKKRHGNGYQRPTARKSSSSSSSSSASRSITTSSSTPLIMLAQPSPPSPSPQEEEDQKQSAVPAAPSPSFSQPSPPPPPSYNHNRNQKPSIAIPSPSFRLSSNDDDDDDDDEVDEILNRRKQQQQSSSAAAAAAKTKADLLLKKRTAALAKVRPDLFLLGVVVMVNGYTNPDTETLQRMLHKHGGDLEKYETSRITHIVAEHLSTAKANIYKRMKKPIPVVQPSWIVDCVKARKLLPHGDYLIPEVRDNQVQNMKSFFQPVVTVNKQQKTLSPKQPPPTTTTTKASSGIRPKGEEEVDASVIEIDDNDSEEEEAESSPPSNVAATTKRDDESTTKLLQQPSSSSSRQRQNVSSSSSPPLEQHASHNTNKEDEPNDEDAAAAAMLLASLSQSKTTTTTTTAAEGIPNQYITAKKSSLTVAGTATTAAAAAATTINNNKGEVPNQSTKNPSAPSITTVKVVAAASKAQAQAQSPARAPAPTGKTDDKFINGMIRTTGTDPNFLDSFFSNSRLSFIGSYKQRIQDSPTKQQKQQLKHGAGKRQSSSSAVVPKKKRFVFHADMDCFFAAVVLRNYPQYQNKPVAISHFGKTTNNNQDGGPLPDYYQQQPKKNSSSECATCNYEARKFGIKKGMFLGRAKELCPHLVILPYDFDGYEQVSEQVSTILQRYAMEYDGQVQQESCDESYLELFFPTIDGERNVDPHRMAGDVANTIRREILRTTRCSATIGVATNKFLAKLATDRVKPNGSFVVRNPKELLRNLKLRDLHGIGHRTAPKLVEAGLVSVQDVWDLGNRGQSELCRILGQGLGKKIYAFCKGEDDRPVQEKERKTISAECNYGVRFDGPYGVDYMIEGLAKEVQKRMEGVGVRGSQVTLKMKQRKKGAKPPPKFLGHGSCHNLSKSQAINGEATRDWKVIAEIGKTLLAELNVDKDDIRGMGITISKLDNSTTTTSSESGTTTSSHGGGKQSIMNWFGTAKTAPAAAATTTTGPANVPTKEGTGGTKTPAGGAETSNDKEDSPPFPSLIQEPESTDAPSSNDYNPPSFSQIDASVLRELPTQIREELCQGRTEPINLHTTNEEDEGSNADGDDFCQQPSDEEEEDVDENMVVQSGTRSQDTHETEAGEPEDTHKTVVAGEPEVGAEASADTVGDPISPQALIVDDGDVALPPLSQIRLSQVEALPSPLKKQINSKISAQRTTAAVETQEKQQQVSPNASERRHSVGQTRKARQTRKRSSSSLGSNGNNKRLRQVSVKRMFRLAEMKAGKSGGGEKGENSISVEELDSLPLELQLQIANNDNCPLGEFSRSSKKGKASTGTSRRNTTRGSRVATTASSSPKTGRDKRRSQSPKADSQRQEESQVEAAPPREAIVEVVTMDPTDFFRDNIAPLSLFMDENVQPTGDPLDQVTEFLCLCVKENRLRDVVLLLRNIKNRNDCWGKVAYHGHLLDAVNEACYEKMGYRLDVDGLQLN